MTIPELKNAARDARFMREAGITLLMASGILSFFIWTSPTPPLEPEPSDSITIATSTASNAFANIPLEAKAAIVYDLALGETLYDKNADVQLPLASLTKLLTVYAALENLAPETPILVQEDAVHVEAPRIFNAGQTLTLEDLSRLTLVASLNDGAVAIADTLARHQNRSPHEALAGAAAALNLPQTYALNGSGLDITSRMSGGYGSARDLAKLAGALVEKAPAIATATTKPYAEAKSASGTPFKVKNTDPMIATIPGLLLSKTGYTDLAGGNLALVIDAGIAHPIAIIVLGSSVKDRFTDGTALVAATLAHFAGVQSL